MGDDYLGSESKRVYTLDGAASSRSPLFVTSSLFIASGIQTSGFACLSFFFLLLQGIPDIQQINMWWIGWLRLPLAGFMLALSLIWLTVWHGAVLMAGFSPNKPNPMLQHDRSERLHLEALKGIVHFKMNILLSLNLYCIRLWSPRIVLASASIQGKVIYTLCNEQTK